MHCILGDVVKKQAAPAVGDVEALIAGVTTQLSVDQSQDNPIDKFPWIPFGQAILAIFPTSDAANIATLQNNLALRLQALGDYQGAKTLLQQALRSAEKNFGPDHPTTAVRYSNLATVLQDLGDYQGALHLSGQAVRIFQTALPPGHPYIKQATDIYQAIASRLAQQS